MIEFFCQRCGFECPAPKEVFLPDLAARVTPKRLAGSLGLPKTTPGCDVASHLPRSASDFPKRRWGGEIGRSSHSEILPVAFGSGASDTPKHPEKLEVEEAPPHLESSSTDRLSLREAQDWLPDRSAPRASVSILFLEPPRSVQKLSLRDTDHRSDTDGNTQGG